MLHVITKPTASLLITIIAAGLAVTSTIGSDVPVDAREQSDARLAWWRDARFGLFIHWGPVSLKGTEIGWSRGKEVPAEEYDKLYKQFNPTRFDADEWVRTAKAAGMKYIVITSKHHDGFSIWPSEYTDYDIAATPFKRDILGELSYACRKHGLKFCTYHSICDWYHPDYPTDSPGGRGRKPDPNMPRYFEFLKNQTREIIQNYGPLGIMWFDGEWEEPWTPAYGNELYGFLRGLQPDLIINNRVSKGRQGMGGTTAQGARNPGDYDTPEQRVGAFSRERPWETCMTICRQWAWKPNDKMKSLKECIDALVRTAGGDGNFLFNVGPMPDGRIEPRQIDRLKEMGAWLDKHGQTIYGTRGGPFWSTSRVLSTHKDNTVYVHVLQWVEDRVTLPPIDKKILSSKVLTGGTAVVKQTDASIEISLPAEDRDELDTIIALELDGPAAELKPRRLPSSSLAFGKKATASNVFQNDPTYSPEKAFDDDPSTRWGCDWGTTSVWLEVDLGEPLTFDHCYISEPYGRVQKFEIQIQKDGQWCPCYSGTTIGEDFQAGFAAVTAQHVRLNLLETTDGPSIWEFQILAPKK